MKSACLVTTSNCSSPTETVSSKSTTTMRLHAETTNAVTPMSVSAECAPEYLGDRRASKNIPTTTNALVR
ncbi:CIC_collapsed_G0028740.mRNA.1.CDS.1 [Saccharomyces cerevisiae]|nr:CIC_collapsed_G0028740.mRNA.1.CDS.1 [Saccharomyces cerevisiae]